MSGADAQAKSSVKRPPPVPKISISYQCNDKEFYSFHFDDGKFFIKTSLEKNADTISGETTLKEAHALDEIFRKLQSNLDSQENQDHAVPFCSFQINYPFKSDSKPVAMKAEPSSLMWTRFKELFEFIKGFHAARPKLKAIAPIFPKFAFQAPSKPLATFNVRGALAANGK